MRVPNNANLLVTILANGGTAYCSPYPKTRRSKLSEHEFYTRLQCLRFLKCAMKQQALVVDMVDDDTQ